jgi:hypothetical protein
MVAIFQMTKSLAKAKLLGSSDEPESSSSTKFGFFKTFSARAVFERFSKGFELRKQTVLE